MICAGGRARSTSGRGCGRGWPRLRIWRGCRPRSRTSAGVSSAVRRSGCASWRSSGHESCGGSWRSRSGWSGHSASNATSVSICRLFVYMRTTTIRVPAETRDRLNALAKRRGAPAGEIVAELVREADDRALVADAEEGWSRMAADPAALAAYRAETGELEAFEAPAPSY